MAKENQYRKKYASDLTDAQWAIVEPMIPPAKQSTRGGRPRKVDMREVLNTLFGTFQIPVDSFNETSGGGRMVIATSNRYDSSTSTTNQRQNDEVYETP